MAVTGIEVVELPVTDLGRAARFYEAALGLERSAATAPDEPGGFALFDFAGGGASLSLQAPAAAPAAPVVALQVAPGTDTGTLLSRIEEAGGKVVSRDLRTPDLLVIGVRDPDGNALELLVPH